MRIRRALTAVALVGVTVLAASGPAAIGAAVPAGAAAETAQPAASLRGPAVTPRGDLDTLTCDRRGDRRQADDCLTHRLIRAASDGTLRTQRTLSVRIGVHRTLARSGLVVGAQIRKVHGDGRPGRWITPQRVRLAPGARELSVRLCTMSLAGTYQVRMRTTWRAAAPGARTADATALTSQASTVQVQPNPGTCVNSDQDEVNVEQFNEREYQDLFEVVVTPLPGSAPSWSVGIQCDPDPYVTNSLAVAIGPVAGSSPPALCAEDVAQTLTVAPTDPACRQQGSATLCDFVISGFNRITATVYSTTEVQVLLRPGLTTSFLPELEPAQIPVCSNTVNECLVDQTCTLDPTLGTLQLCESPTSCQNPITPPGPGPYFTTATGSAP